MPLSELAPGHIGRNGPVEELKEGSPDGIHSGKMPNIGAQSGFPQTPSSIQSMLRNTTETGDVGQFSIRPARVPSVTHRAHKSPRIAQPVHVKKRHDGGQIYGQKDGRQKLMHPSGSSTSIASTSYQSHQHISYREAQRRSAGEEEDERSYSITQSSINSQGLSNRPTPIDFQLHDPGDFRGVRPRSPFAYPTRLKRPGYRPSSPALSDNNKHMPGAYTAPSRTASFRTASPLSIYTTNRVPQMWQQSANRSEPMLRCYAPSPRQEELEEPQSISARVPLSELRSGLSSARSATPTQFSDLSVSRRTSPSPSPVFYDYTESFEESHYHSVSVSSLSVVDQVIQEDLPKVYHELDGNVISQPVAELPADTSHSDTLPPKYEQDLRVQPLSTINVTRKALPSSQRLENLGLPIAMGKEPNPYAKDSDERHMLEKKPIQMSHLMRPASGTTPESGLVSVETSSPNSITFAGSSQHLEASNAPLESIALPSPSPSDSMCSPKSSSQPNFQTQVPESVEASGITSPTGPHLEIPFIQSRRRDAPIRCTKPPVASVQRGTSFDGKSDTTEHTEIYAPTPERAASSLSNRKRFSRILSLNDDLAGTKGFASKAKVGTGSSINTSTEESSVTEWPTVKHRLRHGNGGSTDTFDSEAKVTQSTGLEKAAESGLAPSEISNKSFSIPAAQIPRRGSSRSLNTATSDTPAEPTIPPRRSSYLRKPAYSLFEQTTSRPLPQLPPVTEGLGKSTDLTDDVSSKTAIVPLTMKELPPLPKEPTLVAYSPPIARSPSALPFAFTPLTVPQEDEIPTIDIESGALPVSQKNAGNPAASTVLLPRASSEESINISDTNVEPSSISQPEQGVTQSELIHGSHSKYGADMQADDIDTSHAEQQSTLPDIKPSAATEPSPEQDSVLLATQPEPRRISYSAMSSSRLSESDDEAHAPIPKYKLKMRADRDSSPRSQPWNLDDSYPWTSQSPKLEVTMPQKSDVSLAQSSSAMPRFKLKVQRASSSTVGTTRILKQGQPSEMPLPAEFDVSNDLFRPNPFGRKSRPSITIGQENSSQSLHLQTRFKESFEQPSATFAISPTITLVPPSPGLNFEARSFFSDDSSQIRSRSSLRKRLSQLRAMASRNTMSEDGRSYDSAVLRSRASGRISKQSVRTAENMSRFKSVRFKVAEKVKGWFVRGGEKFRGLWKKGSELGDGGPHG